MGEELKSVSLCLLDDVNLSDNLQLDDFEIRHYQPAELQALLGRGEAKGLSSPSSDQLELYAELPWAHVQRPIPPNKVKPGVDGQLNLGLMQLQLSWSHAGVQSWYPFDDLLRTLNLLKPAGGPVIGRQFYYWLEPLAEADRHVDRIIYGEPLCDDYFDPNGQSISLPALREYELGPSDTEAFSALRRQLAQCLAPDSAPDNSHLKTAIHYFEKADRELMPRPLPGSFDAIDPLMSYEAALEALLIERRGDGEKTLSTRTSAMVKKVNRLAHDRVGEINDFTRRVFSLRSKVAHGARPIKQIEQLIVYRPNDGIPDAWGEKMPIPSGDYANLLIKDGLSFPGFLVNLRELTRIAIRFFCDELSQGRDKATTTRSLDNAD
jgi:hypothetical protein